MSQPPIVSLSKTPLKDVADEGDSLVLHSEKGFSRLKGTMVRALQTAAQSHETRLASLEQSIPEALQGLKTSTESTVAEAIEKHRRDPNAHQFLKERMGLGKVENHPVVALDSDREGYVLASDIRTYMTPKIIEAPSPVHGQGIVLGKAGRFRNELGASVAIGHEAAQGGLFQAQDYIAIGQHAEPIAHHSVTLGHSQTTLHLAKPVATRADMRDFDDPQPLGLGLDFLLKLHPVTAVQDLREDYVNYAAMPLPPALPALSEPKAPSLLPSEAGYSEAQIAYRQAKSTYEVEQANYRRLAKEWRRAFDAWSDANALDAHVLDGTHRAAERRTLLFGSDLRQAAQACDQTFTGVINPQRSLEGLDIDAVRSEELIPVLVNAFQELHRYLHSDAFLDGLAERLYLRKRASRS